MIIRLGIIVLFVCFSAISHAKQFKDFVSITSERKLYVEHIPATEGHPTVVLLNGMTHETKDWKELVAHLQELDPNIGILVYDMYGMGRTMQAYSHRFNPFISWMSSERIHFQEQASDLEALIKKLAIQDFVLAGLSYGGGVAQEYLYQYGKDHGSPDVILMAPFINPIESQVELIEDGINWARHWFPRTDIPQDRLSASFIKAFSQVFAFSGLSRHQWLEISLSFQAMYWNHPLWSSLHSFFPGNYISDEDLYDYFLKVLVYTAYVAAEPAILERPFKAESTFRLAQGMKNFNGFDYVNGYPDSSVHLVVPEKDEYITPETFSKYWDALPPKTRGSRLHVKDGKHKLPQERPALMAKWILKIVRDETGQFKKGDTFRSENFAPIESMTNPSKISPKSCDQALAEPSI